MKRKWRKLVQKVVKILPLSFLILMVVSMTGCLGGGGLSGCTSCIPGMSGGSDLTGVFAIVLVGALVWVFIQKFRKK